MAKSVTFWDFRSTIVCLCRSNFVLQFHSWLSLNFQFDLSSWGVTVTLARALNGMTHNDRDTSIIPSIIILNITLEIIDQMFVYFDI